MSGSDRVMCWLHHRHSDVEELPYSDWLTVVWLVMKYSIAVCGLLKCERVAGLQCLLQCPVLNGKDRRRKLFIIQPLKGVKCLKKEGREWERATDRLIPLCLSLHPSRVLKTAVSQAERYWQSGNSYSQPATRERDGVVRQDAGWKKWSIKKLMILLFKAKERVFKEELKRRQTI